MLYATYYHFEHVHFHINRFYANLGYKEAQHNLGHSYMHGKTLRISFSLRTKLVNLGIGADHHSETAVYWLKQASDQGHAKVSIQLGYFSFTWILIQVFKPGIV